MSVAVSMSTSGPALRFLQQATAGLQPGALLPRLGGVAQRLTQRHLRRINRERPNRLGGARTNFYGKAAQATFFTVAPGGVVITIAKQGMRQRFAGGVITPVNAKYLTIPARAEAHGRRAREFGNLKFAITEQGPALVRASDEFKEVGKRRKDGTRKQKQVAGEGEVVFWLRKRVTQRADPSVIPSAADFARELGASVSQWLNTLAARARAGAANTRN